MTNTLARMHTHERACERERSSTLVARDHKYICLQFAASAQRSYACCRLWLVLLLLLLELGSAGNSIGSNANGSEAQSRLMAANGRVRAKAALDERARARAHIARVCAPAPLCLSRTSKAFRGVQFS